MRSVKVETRLNSYQILIEHGLLARTGTAVRSIASPHCRKAVIVSNRKVHKAYGEVVSSSLKLAGYDTAVFLMGDGERYKTLSTVAKILTYLLEQRVGRYDLILALGGGVVGDVAGFVAATFMRGIDLVQIPTTLLAQIDSSVGGKTGVNHRLGKNLIGAFKQPNLVLIDPDTLVTLPRRELMAAMHEAVKYGAIADSRLFEMLEQEGTAAIEELIMRCCQIKASIVSRDEFETGERRILNFGHTVGHALEAATAYRRFKHGEAVGYGIIAASLLAQELGLLVHTDRQRICSLVRLFGPLPSLDGIDAEVVLSMLHQDKKAVAGRTVFVLLDAIGHAIIRDDIPIEVTRNLIHRLLKRGSYL